jgi:GT2 family glycosyltransferase
MNAPEFSIVIPAFNAAATLGASIESVLNQSREDFELTTVDDGSTDATTEIARSFESDPRTIVIRQKNQGLAAARNAGLAKARGRHVSFLDADDLLMPRYLEQMARAIGSDPGAGIAYGDVWILDEPTRKLHRRTALDIFPAAPERISGEEFVSKLVAGNFLPYCSTVRREAAVAVGGFDASRTAVEDWDFWIRMAASGYGAVRVSSPLAIWRDRPGSMSTDRSLMLENIREVLAKVIGCYDVPHAARVAAQQRLRDVERDARALSGERSPQAALHRIRLRLISWKRMLVNRRDLLPAYPPEVAEAFPDLHLRRSA